MVSMRQEVDHIRVEHSRHIVRAGEAVVWFEMIPYGAPGGSTLDPLYDVSGTSANGKQYKPGVVVPVFWVIENEDDRHASPEGRQPTQTIRFSVGYSALVEAGVTEPWESTRHTGDLIFYDSRYYHFSIYKTMGRVQDDIGITIVAVEEFLDQDLVNDLDVPTPHLIDNPWPSTLP